MINILEVKNLTKYFANIAAVDSINFDVHKGEVIGFLGPNGAGKTTTIRMITGFLTPDRGDVKFKGNSIKVTAKKTLSNTGFLPENNPLYNNLRVDEYLIFSSKMKGINDKSELKKLSDSCGLEDVLTKRIENLSKGYRQRVGLAKSLIGNPELVIMDEPTVGLDPNQKEDILKLIKQYGKKNTILFSSHVLSEVSEITDRVIIINEGKIVAKGKTNDLIKQHFNNALITIKVNVDFKELKRSAGSIKSITDIKKTSEKFKEFFTYKINCTEETNTALEIFNISAKNRWKLVELHSESMGLEDLFKKLTK